jgi:hypothetical protein
MWPSAGKRALALGDGDEQCTVGGGVEKRGTKSVLNYSSFDFFDLKFFLEKRIY